MPAYSFKERFVPMVKDGSKPGTIRNFRKFPIQVGQLAHLFYGMRTKFCMKLVDPSPEIKDVFCIHVSEVGAIALIRRNWIEPELRSKVRLMTAKSLGIEFGRDIIWLSVAECDRFAWLDGFRHADRPEDVTGCCDLMQRYWGINNGLPYIGTWTVWGDGFGV